MRGSVIPGVIVIIYVSLGDATLVGEAAFYACIVCTIYEKLNHRCKYNRRYYTMALATKCGNRMTGRYNVEIVVNRVVDSITT